MRNPSEIWSLDFGFLVDFAIFLKKWVNMFSKLNIYRKIRIIMMIWASEMLVSTFWVISKNVVKAHKAPDFGRFQKLRIAC